MSTGTRYELDVAALAGAIAAVAAHRKISMKEVAAETGLSPSTLTRMTQGQKPDTDALVSLLAWLNAGAGRFTRSRAVNGQSVQAAS